MFLKVLMLFHSHPKTRELAYFDPKKHTSKKEKSHFYINQPFSADATI